MSHLLFLDYCTPVNLERGGKEQTNRVCVSWWWMRCYLAYISQNSICGEDEKTNILFFSLLDPRLLQSGLYYLSYWREGIVKERKKKKTKRIQARLDAYGLEIKIESNICYRL